jgi:hypothetical protein
MLITNFASGELAETLFGRIDLGQYYQGVSRLENFDVIPTGGIERRNGTKRLAALPGEGRISPFLMGRENHFLLFLSPGKISVYSETGGGAWAKAGADAPSDFATLKEIEEAQYAQTQDSLILVHENCPMTEIRFITSPGPGGMTIKTIGVSRFEVKNQIELKITGGINPAGHEEQDPAYAARLKTPGNYPGGAAFFQGRLFFAGGGGNPQRIFASRAGDIHDFSTYKKFLTETREYTTAHGKLEPGSNRVILDENYAGMQFKGKVCEYIADSPYFPPGTGVSDIKGNLLFLTAPTTFDNSLTPEEEEALEQHGRNYSATRRRGEIWGIGSYSEFQDEFIGADREYRYKAEITVEGASATFQAWRWIVGNSFWGYGDVPWHSTAKKEAVLSKEEAALADIESGYIKRQIEDWLIGAGFNEASWKTGAIGEAAAFWRDNVNGSMGFKFRGETFYGNPGEIREQIDAWRETMGTVFIPLYKVNILEDRYPTPDCGFTFEIASDMSDAIRWLGQNKHLVIGTETAEWVIPAGTDAVNARAVLNSRYGSAKIQGVAIGDALVFIQAGGKAAVEYYIPQEDNNFRANNLALLSKNMLHESAAKYTAFAAAPYTKLYICREDGTLAGLLYERSTGTFAWGRITTAGRIVSIAVLPGETGFDELYLAAERGGGFFLERLDGRAPCYLDSSGPWAGAGGGYGEGAAVLDENTLTVYPIAEAPEPGPGMRAGYPFTSAARSMPVLANQGMKPNIIKTLLIRFHESFMPKVKSLPNNAENTIPRKEPYSGVAQVNFPGSFDRDVFFEISISKPAGCRILAISAEAN